VNAKLDTSITEESALPNPNVPPKKLPNKTEPVITAEFYVMFVPLKKMKYVTPIVEEQSGLLMMLQTTQDVILVNYNVDLAANSKNVNVLTDLIMFLTSMNVKNVPPPVLPVLDLLVSNV